MSKVQVDTIDTRSGTSTMQIGSTNTSTINIGVSGDTVNIPSGVTIANAGTATGFGVAGTVSFAARKNANQELSDNAFTKVTFQDEAFDTDSAFADSKFTVPSGKAGKYYFNTQLYFIPNSNTINTFMIHYYINGATPTKTSNYGFSFVDLDFGNNPGGYNNEYTRQHATMFDLSAGDYVEVYGRINVNSGTPRLYSAGNFFMGYRIA